MLDRTRLATEFLGLALAVALAGGCAKSPPQPKAWAPPRVDLARLGTLGMLEFSASEPESLGTVAGREFLAALQSAQPGTPVLELGDEARVLSERGAASLDADAIRAIGERHRVDALVVGRLETKASSPSFAFDSGGRWISASAELEGTLEARIFDARTGATVWSTVASASQPLGRVDVSPSGVSGLGANPAQKAQHRLVRALVARATDDFWAHWE